MVVQYARICEKKYCISTDYKAVYTKMKIYIEMSVV